MRYFLNLFEVDELFPDEEGIICSSLEQAKERALKDARAMMAEDLLRGRLKLDQRIEVLDDRGKLVYILEFGSALANSMSRVHRQQLF